MELTLCIRTGEEDRKDVPSPRFLPSFFKYFPQQYFFLKCGVRASITIALSSVAENESQRNIKSLVLE